MFNKRSFFLGLGIGIIVGAMLLQLFHLGEDSQNRLEEIGQEMGQGGLPTSSAALSGSASPEKNEISATADPNADSGNDATVQTTQSEPSVKPAATPNTEQNGSEEEQEPVPFVVRIEPGMSLTETAELLQSKGAIDDSRAFIDVMKSSGLRVRAGYFLFEKGMVDAEQAAGIVSSKPITADQAKQYGGKAS
jgi:hypothetical protein